MKLIIKVLIGLITVVSLSSCVGTKAITTIVQEGEKVTTTLTGAAVQRDIVYADERKHRDTQTQKMYKGQGIVMTNKMYVLSDGTQAFLPESITVRAPHRYQQNIETRPPDHVGWKTADKIVDVAKTGVLAWGLNAILGTTSGSDAIKYGGDYNYNPQTAAPYIVNPVIVE